MKKAVVFAYHNIGVRCLKTLLAGGIEVCAVISHQDQPGETIWFDSVYQTAQEYGIPVMTPDTPYAPEVLSAMQMAQPDFLFSFYYRHLLPQSLLDIPVQGAFNMHGSLLPQFRGCAPINWAIIGGATTTGATLHVMNAKPDNGPIVDQMAVSILPDDTAQEVFNKVLVAAEIVLQRSLPRLIAGQATFTQQDLSQGSYWGRRKPEDGHIPPQASAMDIHNLVRALTYPFPGAFAQTEHGKVMIWRTLLSGQHNTALENARLIHQNEAIWLEAVDGGRLKVLNATLYNQPLPALPTIDWFIV